MRKTYNYAVWRTQGGGLVKEERGDFVFVEAPHPSTGLTVGDAIPEEWSIVPANDLARAELDDLLDPELKI